MMSRETRGAKNKKPSRPAARRFASERRLKPNEVRSLSAVECTPYSGTLHGTHAPNGPDALEQVLRFRGVVRAWRTAAR